MWTMALLLACGGSEGDPASEDVPTYYQDAKTIIDTKCATCHQPGDVGPFPMTTAEEVSAVAAISEMAIRAGSMPPFQPSRECNSYTTDFGLTEDETSVLTDFFAGGAPAGDADSAVDSSIPVREFEADLVLPLPEPYTPVREPDDYRCQLIDLELTEPTYVVGIEVQPDQRSIVHHTVLFVSSAEQVATYQGYDEAEDGPGWTCFGGPNGENGIDISIEDIQERLQNPDSGGGIGGTSRSIGSWTPGALQGAMPAGTGMRLEPGDQLVVQMHYNTLSASPVADQSTIALQLADEVEFPAVGLPLLDLAWPTGIALLGEPMDIPAGATNATAEVVLERDSQFVQAFLGGAGIGPDETVRIHGGEVHMHELGVVGTIERLAADGSEQCVIDYQDYDFNWQGRHYFADTVPFGPGDAIRLRCQWDNSAENQAVIDGVALEPQDVTWGEGTRDEMCLGSLYITR